MKQRRAHDSISGPPRIVEMLDPAAEEALWRENHAREPYYEPGTTYEDYHPAYRAGWEARIRYAGRAFEEIEGQLEIEFRRCCAASRLGWDKARNAARAAWQRFEATDPFERSQ